ncbi:MAG: NUDIX domain-containing protein [Patescibacteria group bacterium]|nr:NUDIX domain-containing protein [Patescibacteria group bacterium]
METTEQIERSISLLLMTRRVMEPGEPAKLVAVLQLRGEVNHEKDFARESWAHVAQLTAHGKIESGETTDSALYRETREELGESFVCWLLQNIVGPVQIGEVKKPNKTIVHFAVEVPPASIKVIRWNFSSGGSRLITKDDINSIQILPNSGLPNASVSREKGVFACRATYMFPDELEALKAAFAHFENAVPAVTTAA